MYDGNDNSIENNNIHQISIDLPNFLLDLNIILLKHYFKFNIKLRRGGNWS
jgi:hypothetical protein